MKLNLFFLLGVIIIAFLNIGSDSAESLKEPIFNFNIIITDVDWDNFEADVNVKLDISFLPYNLSSIGCFVDNNFEYITDNGSRRLDGGSIYVTANQTDAWTYNGKTYYRYRGEKSQKFKIFGRPEFYPYDSYMINLTIKIPYFSIKNESLFSVYSCFLEENWFRESSSPQISFRDWAHINYKIYIRRQDWTYLYLEMILNFAFLFLGGLFLIEPDELRHRLSIIIPLFIFIATFHFQIPLPHRTGITFYELRTFVLSIAISVMGFLNIFEYFLMKKISNSQTKKACIIIELFVLTFVSSMIYKIYENLSSMIRYYPWITPPSSYETIFWVNLGFIARILITFIYGKSKTVQEFIYSLEDKMRKMKK